MENFIVWMDAEKEASCRCQIAKLESMFPDSVKISERINTKSGLRIKRDYRIMNNRCYVAVRLDYEDPNTAKIWAMISKYNTEMVRKYPTLKMSA